MTQQTTDRYRIALTGDGDALIWDSTEKHYVLTNSGQLYYAPVENAQWVVDTMNRTAQVTPEAAPIAREEAETESESGTPLTVGDEVVDTVSGEIGHVFEVGTHSFIVRFVEGDLEFFIHYSWRSWHNGRIESAPVAAPVMEPVETPLPKPVIPNPLALLHVMPSREMIETESVPVRDLDGGDFDPFAEQAPEDEFADWELALLDLPESDAEKAHRRAQEAHERTLEMADRLGHAIGALKVAQATTVGIEWTVRNLRNSGTSLGVALTVIEDELAKLRLYLAESVQD